MSNEAKESLSSGAVAVLLAKALDKRQTDYALGGAIALGFWGRPRGTVDVDLNLFLPRDKPTQIVWELQEIGCEVQAAKAIASIREHGFCSVDFQSVRVDVFVPSSKFYEHAKARRKRVFLGQVEVAVLDAETLAVFKMMFFRPQDFVDIEQIIRMQGGTFDRGWVREQLVEIFGSQDARIVRWDELLKGSSP